MLISVAIKSNKETQNTLHRFAKKSQTRKNGSTLFALWSCNIFWEWIWGSSQHREISPDHFVFLISDYFVFLIPNYFVFLISDHFVFLISDYFVFLIPDHFLYLTTYHFVFLITTIHLVELFQFPLRTTIYNFTI